jgi:hypothetical protein
LGKTVGVVPNSLEDIGRASDGAKRRPVKAEGWAYIYHFSINIFYKNKRSKLCFGDRVAVLNDF